MPKLGDIGVVATGSWQAWCIRLATRSEVNHAFVYVGNDNIVEGNPNGANLAGVEKYPNAIWLDFGLTDTKRASVAAHARDCIGVKYNWLDDAAIGVAKLLGRKTPHFIALRLSDRSHLQCSQLADQCYRDAGVHLFKDGRETGEVAPGDLLTVYRER